MADQLTATVIGGGIAGLASAASLLQAGWKVTVLERSPAFTEVGAGVAITRNGMTALDVIGAGDIVRTAGHMTRTAGFQDQRGRWVLRVPDTPTDQDSPSRLCAIHRQRLHAALLQTVDGADLMTGAQVIAVEPGAPTAAPATVTWVSTTGEQVIESDLVVAADGVRSTVRGHLFPGIQPEYGGATSWRAVIEDSEMVDDRFIAVWGAGAEFGALRISANEVYWYGYFKSPANSVFDDELGTARAMFAHWPALVTDTVAATTPSQLMRHDVYHLPKGLPTYVRGRVVMVGDAAHAFLPTMGQGVATSLEDGACVGRLIARPVNQGAALAPALAAYDRARQPRCRKIARQAVMIGRLGAHLGGGWRQSVRNTLLRLTPAGLFTNTDFATQLVGWTPPSGPSPITHSPT